MYYLMQCPCCGIQVLFDELERHTALSLLIDPETGLPTDYTDPVTGLRVWPTPESTARARRRPLCADCIAQYKATGTLTSSVRLKGETEALGVSEHDPLLDDEGRVMAVVCPVAGCGKVVELVNGKIPRHFVRGRKCKTSGVQVGFFFE